MPAKCKICGSADKLEIEKKIRDGTSNRRTASLYALSEAAVRRHKKHMLKDIGRALIKSEKPTPAEIQCETLDSVGQLIMLKERAEHALDAAEEEKNHLAAVAWFREVRQCLELMCKVRLAEIKILQEQQKIPAGESPREMTAAVKTLIDAEFGIETDAAVDKRPMRIVEKERKAALEIEPAESELLPTRS